MRIVGCIHWKVGEVAIYVTVRKSAEFAAISTLRKYHLQTNPVVIESVSIYRREIHKDNVNRIIPFV